MKITYRSIAAFFFMAVFCLPMKAQDTLVVDGGPILSPVKNALYNAIKGDTNATGERLNANRVYKLKKNLVYWNTERIENPNFTLRIVGEYVAPNGSDYPAEIQMVARDDQSVDGRIITGQSSVTLKNVWLTGRDNNGVQTYYQPIQMDASNSQFIIDNCILEQTNFALIAFTGSGNTISYTNCKFRNLIGSPSTQQWEGRGISIWADQDSVIVENCTFFNVEFTSFQLEGGSAKYLRFNHNTIVNQGRQVTTGSWFQNAYITNCLIVNGWWQGEGYADLHSSGRDPRDTHSGLFGVGALPSVYGPEQGRRIVIANMAAYLDPAFTTMYGDTIHRAYYTNPVTNLDFFNKYTEHMKIQDTVWLNTAPSFPTYADIVSDHILDSMKMNITQLRAGVTPATPYFFRQAASPIDITWPLPENFTYTDASLKTMGTDGLPLGDLNWFPSEKATFEAGKDGYIAQIEAMAGKVIVLNNDSTAEAENAVLGGTAAVSKFNGFSYFYMQSGGFIQWDFNLAAGGDYNVNIWSFLENNTQRGQHFFINGNEIHDNYGWGELEFTSSEGKAGDPSMHGPGSVLSNTKWNWYYYPKDSILAGDQANFTFITGHNTIKITPSWGYQDFAGIDLIQPGTVVPSGETVNNPVIALRAPDATSGIVTPKGEGAPWVPSLFKSVSMGTSGTISFTLNVKTTGTYHVRIFYQNPGSAQNIDVKEGNSTLTSLSLPGKADSTGLDILSDAFPLTSGSHTIQLSGGNLNIDYIQLISEVTSVRQTTDVPHAYTLSQNYPNPFNPTTKINFSLAKASNVRLTVYNILGQSVATLINNEHFGAGEFNVTFDASHLSTGVYFYRIEAAGFTSSKKMMLIK